MHAQIIKSAVACAWSPYLTFSMSLRLLYKKTLIVIISCRKKKYDMQILKMTWKIDFVEISMKKSKRGIGSQVRPRETTNRWNLILSGGYWFIGRKKYHLISMMA